MDHGRYSRIFKISISSIVMMSLFSCGVIPNGSDPSSTSSSQNEVTLSGISAGKYKQPGCDKGSFNSSSFYWEITTDNWYGWDIVNSDIDCNVPLFQRRFAGYHVSSSSQPLHLSEFQNETHLYEMLTDQAVAKANADSFCEISDWKLNAPRDVYNKVCTWQFTAQSRIIYGTSKDGFKPKEITIYAKELGGRLCVGEKEIDASSPPDHCWTRFN